MRTDPVLHRYGEDSPRAALLVCEHAGVGIPEHLEGRYPAQLLRSHYGSDLGTDALTQALSERLGVQALCAQHSRIVIDCNRRLDDPSLILPVADGVVVTANQSVSAEDRELRVRGIYAPLHAQVEKTLARIHERHADLVYIAVHSFTPQLGDHVRPWDAGIMWDVDDRVAMPVVAALKSDRALQVGLNEPYSGRAIQDFSVDFHAERQGFANISIEVRQDHLASAEGVRAWADRLAAALAPLVASPPPRLRTATANESPEFAVTPDQLLQCAGRWGVQRAS